MTYVNLIDQRKPLWEDDLQTENWRIKRSWSLKSGGRAFQSEGPACEKTLRWERTRSILSHYERGNKRGRKWDWREKQSLEGLLN